MSDLHVRTDEDLVEDYLDGDAAAFRLLIERHHDALIRFLNRLMGNRQAAEDVFQETFLQIHTSLETFDLTRRFKPLLFTIAANKGRDALRKAQRRPAVSLNAAMNDRGGSFVDLLEVDVADAWANLEAEDRSRLVQKAIDGMSPRLREILLLAYFQKLSYAQIAEDFGIPLGTVKSRLHAAVASFARKWSEIQAEMDDTENGEGKKCAGDRTSGKPRS